MGLLNWLKQLFSEKEERIGPSSEELVTDERFKWAEEKKKILKEIAVEEERQNLIVPKGLKTDPKWKPYYIERATKLENEALSLPARMLWVTRVPDKKTIVHNYLAIIDSVIASENIDDQKRFEEQLHKLENDMKVLVQNDAQRIRTNYKEFFK